MEINNRDKSNRETKKKKKTTYREKKHLYE